MFNTIVCKIKSKVRQEAHGPHRSLEKTSSNQYTFAHNYDHNIMLIWRGKKPIIFFLMIKWSSYVKPCVFFTQECFVPSLLEIGKWFWRRRFLNLGNVFLLFFNYLPLEKGVVLHLYKLEPPSPKDVSCEVRLKLAQRSCRKRWKCEKFTDGWTEGRWTTGDQKSSLRLRWAKKNC